ncbi:MAG: formate--tetrahydrofolate ligase [Candidatus Omnitrophota bacterium]|nr:formate--tetrahydrofolate ligase [Candidatus Omnitrophota bacterium]
MKSDLEICKKAKLLPIVSIARKLGIAKKYLELYGDYKAKVSLDILKHVSSKKRGKYVDVTAITPTPLGEGKTVTTIGLSMALNRIGRSAVCNIRQPSLGPVFGIKGGAAGGGYSQVVPMEDFNLHLTGDVHAVGLAHNLCAAFLDNHLFRKNMLGIDLDAIFWRRVVDVSDRSLRNVRIGLGGRENGVERDSGFDITVASEVMAILALASSMSDLRKRIARIVVALTKDKKPVTCEDLKVAGAMTALLKDAIKPTLLQTLDNTPCLVHAGPFANIAHGNSSVLADWIAIGLADYVVTESGFGADCGAEKFFDIKCRYSGLKPDAVVLVCSIRALKMHSGIFTVVAGKPIDKGLVEENLGALEEGCVNMEKQIENIALFGVPCVVAINKFDTDTRREIDMVRRLAFKYGAFDCVVSTMWRNGSRGGVDLAKAVAKAAEVKSKFKFLYPLEWPIKKKIETIAKKIYGAKDVRYEHLAEENIALYEKLGFAKFPICMAKTHLSLSHDPALKGRPSGFVLPVKEVRPSAGAGFLYVLCGEMRTMPSLPSHPVGEKIDIDSNGKIVGLS